MKNLRQTVFAALGLGLGLGWSTCPARAARIVLDDIIRVTDSTPSNGDGLKSVQVDCPAGWSVISGGVALSSIDPVDDVIAIARSHPLDLPSQGWFAYAYETSPGVGDWRLSITAVCVDSTELVRVTTESTTTSVDLRIQSADCPQGLDALGGGFSINASLFATQFAAVGSELRDAGTEWSAKAQEFTSTSTDWSLEVTAICGELGNHNDIHSPFASANTDRLLLRIDCPLGQVMISPGATLTGTPPASFVLKQIPASNPTITAAVFESVSAASGITVRSSARCLDLAVFADGFESGDPGGWSTVIP